MKPSLKRWFRRILIVAGVVLAIVVLRATVFRPDPLQVTVYHADRGAVEATVVNSRSGTVHSRHEAEISPAVSGMVTTIHVRKGDRVSRGQLLLELDSSVERAQVDLSRRAKAAADASQQEACLTEGQRGRDLDRARQLSEGGLVSASFLEEAETAYEIARSTCQGAKQRASQAEASLRVAQAMLEKTKVVSPFDGVLARLDTEVGEWVTPAAPGLFIPSVISLVDPDRLYVTAPLDEVDLGRVSVGLPVRITMDALPGTAFKGRMTWKSPRVETKEQENRTLEVEAVFEDAVDASQVVPGASADLEIILETREDVLRIPSYAILSGGKVLVLREGELVEVNIESGLKNWEFAEVTSGLREGEAVVISLDREEIKAGAQAQVETKD